MRFFYPFVFFCWAFLNPLQAQDSIPVVDSNKTPALPDSGLVVGTDTNSIQPLPTEPSKINPTRIDTLGLIGLEVSLFPKGFEFRATANDSSRQASTYYAGVKINGKLEYFLFKDNKAQKEEKIPYKGQLYQFQVESKIGKSSRKQTYLVHAQTHSRTEVSIRAIPLWWSLIPPMVAILFALIFKEVLISLFLGIFVGAWVVNGMPLHPYYFAKALFQVIDTYILHSLTEPSHVAVVVFSILIGGVVAIISRNGGMAGIVQKLSPLARTEKSTQFVAWLLGIAIFFDDYANSLIVGNTMRPLFDKYKISREKLSYIVDSTAAPVSAIAFITTWIGAELGYISDALPLLEGLENPQGAYSIFLSSLTYSFYPLFTIIFMLVMIGTGRDFGAMYKAEYRARSTGQVFEQITTADETENGHGEDLKTLEPVKGAPLRWINGFLPILVVVVGTLLGLLDTGMASCYQKLTDAGVELANNQYGTIWAEIHQLETDPAAMSTLRKLGILVGNADSYNSLLWASLSALIVAAGLTMAQRIQNMLQTLETAVLGFKTMLPALLILVLAWSLATTTKELGTADFLTQALGDSVSPYMLPVIIFFLAGVVAFSTGSSWSTMAILYPIAIPLTWAICQNYGLSQADSMPILYNVIATVLAASVFGDHCSPISDTTILSSLSSSCPHIAHVNTQMPYAFFVGGLSIAVGYVATAFGTPFWLNMLIGIGAMYAVLRIFGKNPNHI